MKYNISVTITNDEKRYIIRDLADAIEGRVCEQLGMAPADDLDPETDKLVKDAATKLYEPYLKRLLKAIGDELEISGESIDLVFDLAPYAKAADKISNHPDVQRRVDEACEGRDLERLTRAADRLGYSLVSNED